MIKILIGLMVIGAVIVGLALAMFITIITKGLVFLILLAYGVGATLCE